MVKREENENWKPAGPQSGGRGRRRSFVCHGGKVFMALLMNVRWALVAGAVGLLPLCGARAENGFAADGGEFGIAGVLPGQQVYPQLSIRPSGGYLVWEDNVTDGSGSGISARRLDGSLSGTLNVFRVNENGADDQERPMVSQFAGGGALFVWESGRQGFQHVYGRVISPAGTWLTGDFLVSGATNVYQLEAASTALTNGNVVVTWSSFNQVDASSLRDVYLQVVSPTGEKLGPERLVNQATTFNQRSSATAGLSDGRFVVVWVSEQQRFEGSVDIYGRLFSASGSPLGSEFLINAGTNLCANPSVAASPDGGFAVAWSEFDLQNPNTRWDVAARPFTANAFGGTSRRVNTHLPGDQVGPKLSAAGNSYFMVWTSVGQDGSREGIYGQFLAGDGSLVGNELRVNSTTVSQQQFPAVASDGTGRFLTVWGSFVGGVGGVDLYSQRFVNTATPLAAPAAPVVTKLDASSLSISWPPVQGLNVAQYEVYADGGALPAATGTNTLWTATGLAPASTHSYRLAYVLADGRRSPLSEATTNTTYGTILYAGIPVEWMAQYFGQDWPAATADSDGDGDSNRDEYLRGTDPTDKNSVLRPVVRSTSQGLFLDWPTVPGLMYQVQSSAAVDGVWANVGGPRFAAGTNDSVYVGGASAGFYRVGRLR